MPDIRGHWRDSFHHFPPWTCPTCLEGTLRLDRNSFNVVETGPSKAAHAHEAWDPEWIIKRFVGLLACQACGELVSIAGDAMTTYFQTDQGEQVIEDLYRPISLAPSPPVFVVARKCPADVAEALSQSFNLIWADTEAAANRLRSAVEALLTDRGIARTTVNGKGKRQPLTLHARIDKYRAKNQEAADFLMAIKWLGNAGSHAAQKITRPTLLDAYELLEHAIDLIYVRRTAALKRVARAMIARKGRPARKKR